MIFWRPQLPRRSQENCKSPLSHDTQEKPFWFPKFGGIGTAAKELGKTSYMHRCAKNVPLFCFWFSRRWLVKRSALLFDPFGGTQLRSAFVIFRHELERRGRHLRKCESMGEWRAHSPLTRPRQKELTHGVISYRGYRISSVVKTNSTREEQKDMWFCEIEKVKPPFFDWKKCGPTVCLYYFCCIPPMESNGGKF